MIPYDKYITNRKDREMKHVKVPFSERTVPGPCMQDCKLHYIFLYRSKFINKNLAVHSYLTNTLKYLFRGPSDYYLFIPLLVTG